MKHLFVPYELAVKLKDIGFHELCFGKFLIPEIPENQFRFNTEGSPKDYNTGLYGRFISAPLYQQVADWFREKHDLVITVYANASGYCFELHDSAIKGGSHRLDSDFSGPNDSGCWDKYYDSVAKAIEEAIKLTNPQVD